MEVSGLWYFSSFSESYSLSQISSFIHGTTPMKHFLLWISLLNTTTPTPNWFNVYSDASRWYKGLRASLLLSSVSQMMMVPSLVLSSNPDFCEFSLTHLFNSLDTGSHQTLPIDLNISQIHLFCLSLFLWSTLPPPELNWHFPIVYRMRSTFSAQGLPSLAPTSCPALSPTLWLSTIPLQVPLTTFSLLDFW